MKKEWKKTEKQIYLPGNNPTTVTIPKMKYFSITGIGNPNHSVFSEKISTLYGMAYAIRMMPKWGTAPEGYQEYTVYPLEGIWDLTTEGRQSETLDKDQLVYKIMIRQPEFVTPAIADMARERVLKKNPTPWLDQLVFEEMEDGRCVQMMHIGTFDSEPLSFARMDAYLEAEGLVRKSKIHKEIYLSDFQKTKPEALKTVLRYFLG
jgi:hypothetical protein